MDKLDLTSPDLTARNIDAVAELFPGVVTETRDADGTVRRGIDFDLLRQELSDHVVEGPQERYRLDWPGKRAALLAANAPIRKTLRPVREESVDFDTTKNIFIEGDNLEALKLLQESYLGKVKLIYIDPPYNTGNDFIYNDDFAESAAEYLARSGQTDDSGAKLVANTESNGRFHSDWLSMMYPRLKLARNLLRDDGVFAASVDSNEIDNMRKICDEVFGSQNFAASISVQVNPRGRHLDKFIAQTHENILLYARNATTQAIGGMAKNDRMTAEYDRSDNGGPFRLLGLRNRNQAFNPTTRPNLYYPLYVSTIDGSVHLEPGNPTRIEILPDAPDGTQTCWTWSPEKVRTENDLLVGEQQKTGEWRIYRKDYLLGSDGNPATTMAKSLWLDPEFSNDNGRRAIKELFGKSIMDFPKSTSLIGRLVEISSKPGDIVMDFFAGSATTAHAVMEINSTEKVARSFILIQIQEKIANSSPAGLLGFESIASLARDRIRKAGSTFRKSESSHLDLGFRALRVDVSNINDVLRAPGQTYQQELGLMTDSIVPGRTGEDLMLQVLLDWGLELSLPIARETVDHREVFVVDGGALIACFAEHVSPAVVREMAARQPLRAVFRDSGFGTDAERINAEQIFQQVSPATDVKTI